jgi:hypothetical protein
LSAADFPSPARSSRFISHQHPRRQIMGKYLIGWLLGVPVFVLVILYFFFH